MCIQNSLYCGSEQVMAIECLKIHIVYNLKKIQD